MHLLHCSRNPSADTLTIYLVKDVQNVPFYAILSHRWRSEEITFQDCDGVADITTTPEITSKAGYNKLLGACIQSLEDGIPYIWVDTCCIDKSSSAELSEAINSMCSWYELSRVCYAFLDDVDPLVPDTMMRDDQFQNSTWFQRGWTLQELLAPTEVIFFDAGWKEIGRKAELASAIAKITHINKKILRDGLHAHHTNVAEKMSWAAGRQTTRDEDRAYSLLGLFGVHMPIIYGEGSRAFRRLQLAVIQESTDHSIFAWQGRTASSGILAETPDQFWKSSCETVEVDEYLTAFDIVEPKLDFTPTNFGLHIQLPVAEIRGYPGTYYAFLACAPRRKNKGRKGSELEKTESSDRRKWVVIYLKRNPRTKIPRFTRATLHGRWTGVAEPRGLEIDKTPFFVLSYEEIWPLAWESDEVIPPQSHRRFPDRTVTFFLAKTHPSIEITDAAPRDFFTASNEVRLRRLPAFTSNDFRRLIARHVTTDNIGFGRRRYAAGRHICTIMVSNERIGSRMLMVLVVGDCSIVPGFYS